MDNKPFTYEWCVAGKGFFKRSRRVSAHQEEMTLETEVEILKLLRKHDLKSLADLRDKMNTEKFMNAIIVTGEIYELLRLLLQPRLKIEQIKAMPLTIQGRVISDFFGLNPGLVILFRSFPGAMKSFPEKEVNPAPQSNS